LSAVAVCLGHLGGRIWGCRSILIVAVSRVRHARGQQNQAQNLRHSANHQYFSSITSSGLLTNGHCRKFFHPQHE
jgi:hypothetical protein